MEEQKQLKQMAERQREALVRSLAPEDVLPGMYVTVVRCVVERLRRSCGEDAEAWREGVRRYEVSPWYAGMPLRAVGVCLPFVLVKRADGMHWTLDTRRHTLARLSDRYGAEAFARYGSDWRESEKGEDEDDDD